MKRPELEMGEPMKRNDSLVRFWCRQVRDRAIMGYGTSEN